MANILISGTSSGLGASLSNLLGGDCFDRNNIKKYKNISSPFDLTIHCAFERYDRNIKEVDYINRATELTSNFISIPSKRIIFISSIDCNCSVVTNPYVKAKKECEYLITNMKNALSLRVPSMFGPTMIKNQIYRIATEKEPKLTLSQKSTFSLLSHSDLSKFIKLSENTGTLSLVSDLLKLETIADFFNSKPHWGEHVYNTKVVKDNLLQINMGKSLDLYKDFILAYPTELL